MGKLILGTTSGTSTAWQIIGRMIAAAVVLAITAFFTPGFTINNIWSLVIAAIVLTILDYLIVNIFSRLCREPTWLLGSLLTEINVKSA